jgi:hypothetical protein
MIAVVAEPDHALRALVVRVLRDAGYQIIEALDAHELAVALWTRPWLDAPAPLAVMSVALATLCAGALTVAAGQRARAGATQIRVILTYEMGTLATVAKPSLGPCEPLAIFEKPFDLDKLKRAAQEQALGS